MANRYYKIEPGNNGIVANTEYAQKVVDDILWLIKNCDDKICINITDVVCMTVKFASLTFGRILLNLGDEKYNERIEIVCDDKSVMAAVEMGINQAFNRKNRSIEKSVNTQITSKDAMRLVVDKIYNLHSKHIEKVNEEIRNAAKNGLTRVKVYLPIKVSEMSTLVVYYNEQGFKSAQGVNNGYYIWVSWCDTELLYE